MNPQTKAIAHFETRQDAIDAEIKAEQEAVYCHGCSEAGGAGMPIYHLPPTCSDIPAKAEQGGGE